MVVRVAGVSMKSIGHLNDGPGNEALPEPACASEDIPV